MNSALDTFDISKNIRGKLSKVVRAMEYLTVKEAGEKWGVTARMVNYYCSDRRIPGAVKKGNLWLVPNNGRKPIAMRCTNNALRAKE